MHAERPRPEIVEKIQHEERLDGAAEAIQRAGGSVLASDSSARRILTGVPLGHPLHPALVAVPIGAWLSASVLDLTAGNRAAARRLVGFGCLAAAPTAAAGLADWLETTGPARRVGLVHAGLNNVALSIYLTSWRSRRKGHNLTGAALALAGSTVLAAGGWLGAHLAYSLRVGVEPEPDAAHTSAH